MAGEEVDQLGPAGRRLYDSLCTDTDPYSLTVIVVEAARIKDRLDLLHSALTGEEGLWLRIDKGRDGMLELRVDSALQEARQQETVLRALLAEIRRHKDVDAPAGERDDLDGL